MCEYARILKGSAFRMIIGSFFIAALVCMAGCNETDDHAVPEADPVLSVDAKQTIGAIQPNSKEADLFIQEMEEFSGRIVVRNGLFYVNASHVRNEGQEWRWDTEFRAALKERNKMIQQKSINVEAVLFNQWQYLDNDAENSGQFNKDSRTGGGSDRAWVQSYWWGYKIYLPHDAYVWSLWGAAIVGSGLGVQTFGLSFIIPGTAAYLGNHYSLYGYGRGAILWAFTGGMLPIVINIEYPQSGIPPEEPVRERPPDDENENDREVDDKV